MPKPLSSKRYLSAEDSPKLQINTERRDLTWIVESWESRSLPGNEQRDYELSIAIDIVSSRLDLAKELGATHTINSKDTNAIEEIKKITTTGVDSSIDTSARPEVIKQAVEALGKKKLFSAYSIEVCLF